LYCSDLKQHEQRRRQAKERPAQHTRKTLDNDHHHNNSDSDSDNNSRERQATGAGKHTNAGAGWRRNAAIDTTKIKNKRTHLRRERGAPPSTIQREESPQKGKKAAPQKKIEKKTKNGCSVSER